MVNRQGSLKVTLAGYFCTAILRHNSSKIFLLFILFTAVAGSCLAASSTVNVSAVIQSKSICKFKTKSAVLDFSGLDPVAAPDVTRQTILSFVCNGSAVQATYLITDDDGLNESGPNGNRMLHNSVSAVYLPYSLSLNPSSDTIPKGILQTLTVTGTVLGNDYRNALVGTYTDTVTLTITP